MFVLLEVSIWLLFVVGCSGFPAAGYPGADLLGVLAAAPLLLLLLVTGGNRFESVDGAKKKEQRRERIRLVNSDHCCCLCDDATGRIELTYVVSVVGCGELLHTEKY